MFAEPATNFSSIHLGPTTSVTATPAQQQPSLLMSTTIIIIITVIPSTLVLLMLVCTVVVIILIVRWRITRKQVDAAHEHTGKHIVVMVP